MTKPSRVKGSNKMIGRDRSLRPVHPGIGVNFGVWTIYPGKV